MLTTLSRWLVLAAAILALGSLSASFSGCSSAQSCEVTSDCDDGFLCSTDGECIEVDLGTETPCEVDGDCGEGNVCQDGVCAAGGEFTPCSDENDCEETETCNGGFCVPAQD